MRDPVQHFVDGGNHGQDREEIFVISIGYLEIRPCVPLVGGIHPASGPGSDRLGLGRKRGEAAFLCLDDV